ncbi:hypothetical protein [Mesorhizobium sp. M7A.F.Ca.MR.362.00.0.0]|uniref:hypothetical protein n=1 Tax=Mesorhizobium sp. M7A.F.Ca.MR.362.00.0.0 TaxID=2496779 RepID=UPI000FD489FA|nr:hypothetical protein [Mesorhizobium sp. M7A.F.Ca.MR.362.00.0.0]RUU76135.1 hypothetical protein EOC06_28165 [Mesorhizobium sp. M7A.F.Ca.MR.362.00.0.0]RWN95397.1 MAG: hypothetical protein EOS05_11430 [Mesorhizobium sp.]
MSNQFAMRCPECGDDAHIQVAALVWVKLVSDGTDADGDHEWDDESPCRCNSCDYTAKVINFTEGE